MKTLRSYVYGRWYEASKGFVPLLNPSTEEEVGRVSSDGMDFAEVVACAREKGSPALRELTFAERGKLLKAMSKTLREHRDELLELSTLNTGTTRPDGAFDIDGGGGTFAFYAGLSKGLGERRSLVDGDGIQLAKSEAFWAQHVWVPRHGVAVAVNAYNFPVWGFAEKAACALLAGMPMIVKPATATAMVAERAVAAIEEAGILPEGALQLICGGTGDLLDRLGPQDILAFTGSAATAARLRDRTNLRTENTRVNVEADSLNAAVLSPDLSAGDAAYEQFLTDVVREITQKSGQKCTAVRRILVPEGHLDQVQRDLIERLEGVVTGDPAEESVTMGPVATEQQLADCEQGVEELLDDAVHRVHGPGRRSDGVGAADGKGYFFPPTLLRADDPRNAPTVHRREIFGPAATLMPYDGAAADAADIVALAGGTLVTSAYTDDASWLDEFMEHAAHTTGRLYIGSQEAADSAPGSGIALPQTVHGGPGRAGGGEELGGLRGVTHYMQRLALQGSRRTVEAAADVEADEG